MPIALPSDAAERYRLDSNTTSAYNVCRDLEEHAANHGTIQDLINARNIRLLIISSPTITAQHNVVNVIHSCSKSPCFLELEMPTGLQVASMNAIKVRGHWGEGKDEGSEDVCNRQRAWKDDRG